MLSNWSVKIVLVIDSWYLLVVDNDRLDELVAGGIEGLIYAMSIPVKHTEKEKRAKEEKQKRFVFAIR